MSQDPIVRGAWRAFNGGWRNVPRGWVLHNGAQEPPPLPARQMSSPTVRNCLHDSPLRWRCAPIPRTNGIVSARTNNRSMLHVRGVVHALHVAIGPRTWWNTENSCRKRPSRRLQKASMMPPKALYTRFATLDSIGAWSSIMTTGFRLPSRMLRSACGSFVCTVVTRWDSYERSD